MDGTWGVNSAPTDSAWLIGTAQSPSPEQPPLQPAKAKPGSGEAVR